MRGPRFRTLAGAALLTLTVIAAVILQLGPGIVRVSATETSRGPVMTTPISRSQAVEYDIDVSVTWRALLPLVTTLFLGLGLILLPLRRPKAQQAAT